jgi:hypothetical protein
MRYQILKGIVRYMLTLFVLSFSVTALYAQIDPDGNPVDWPAVLNDGIAAVKSFKHDATNTNDDQFTQGSQDDNVMTTKWRWNLGNTNDKGDIQNTGAALIGNILYFFGDRTALNGTAQIGFWFFLNDVYPKPDGTFNSDHAPGDLLILSNFTNGGGTVGIKVYRFVKYQGGKAVFELLTTGIVAGAKVNDAEYNVPTDVTGWTYQSKGGPAGKYVVGSFFEGFVDLSKLTGSNICFQQFLMETRNSAELSASQQDMAANDFDVLPDVNLNVTIKDGITKSSTVTAACPELYIIDALKTTTADVTATGATSFTYTFTYSNGGSVPSTEATFTPSNGTGVFEIKSADAFGKTYRIIATGSNGPGCIDKDTVCINVTGSAPPCVITGPDPVCPTTTNKYLYNPDGSTPAAEPLPGGFDAKWSLINNGNSATPGAVDDENEFEVTAGAICGTEYTVKLELTSTTGFGSTSCTLTVDVDVNSALVIQCPADKPVTCSESKLPANTGDPTVQDNGCGIKIYYKDVITRTWIAQDACGNRDTCTQVITVTDSCVTRDDFSSSSARMITNTGTAPTQVVSPVTSLKSPAKTVQDAPVLSRKTTSTSLNTRSKELQIQAFPNPFSNTVNFRFVSPVSGRAILEVFNTQGQRVGIAFDGKLDAGVLKNVQFSTRLTNQALIYRLKVGDKTVRGTVLELKR